MGVIFIRDGKPYVFEAIATVRYTPLDNWIARGDGGALRRQAAEAGTDAQQAAKLRKRRSLRGQAVRPVLRMVGQAHLLLRARLEDVSTSALGIELGARQKLREFDLGDPAVRAKMRERYGTHVPLEEPVISPGAAVRVAAARDWSEVSKCSARITVRMRSADAVK